MILSMALQAVYNIVDSAFVGNMRSGSEAAPVSYTHLDVYKRQELQLPSMENVLLSEAIISSLRMKNVLFLQEKMCISDRSNSVFRISGGQAK